MIPWGSGLVQAITENVEVWEQVSGYLVDKNEIQEIVRKQARLIVGFLCPPLSTASLPSV